MKRRPATTKVIKEVLESKIDKNLIKTYVLPLHRLFSEIRKRKIGEFQTNNITVLIPKERENYAVMIRRRTVVISPARSFREYHIIVLDNGVVTSGQYLKRGNLHNFDLSPDGQFLIFGQVSSKFHITAISRVPFFSGLEVYEPDHNKNTLYPPYGECAVGGVWIDNETVMLCGESVKIDERPRHFKQVPKKKFRQIRMDVINQRCMNLNYREMQAELKKLKLPSSGTHAVLKQRFRDFYIKDLNRPNYDGVDNRVEHNYVMSNQNADVLEITPPKEDEDEAMIMVGDDNYFLTYDGLLMFEDGNGEKRVVFNFFEHDAFVNIPVPQDYYPIPNDGEPDEGDDEIN